VYLLQHILKFLITMNLSLLLKVGQILLEPARLSSGLVFKLVQATSNLGSGKKSLFSREEEAKESRILKTYIRNLDPVLSHTHYRNERDPMKLLSFFVAA
jgi:hypothetical protein